mmetsp:Transcript_112154/g.362124  ORF Transcript_112154/g.362124 Transcript_112154/m.362124 type:complete len:220 (-) Transcript_112154:308-967(-)
MHATHGFCRTQAQCSASLAAVLLALAAVGALHARLQQLRGGVVDGAGEPREAEEQDEQAADGNQDLHWAHPACVQRLHCIARLQQAHGHRDQRPRGQPEHAPRRELHHLPRALGLWEEPLDKREAARHAGANEAAGEELGEAEEELERRLAVGLRPHLVEHEPELDARQQHAAHEQQQRRRDVGGGLEPPPCARGPPQHRTDVGSRADRTQHEEADEED